MNTTNLKSLIPASLLLAALAVAVAFASGSHFEFGYSSGGFKFEMSFKAESGWFSQLLGFTALALFVFGVCAPWFFPGGPALTGASQSQSQSQSHGIPLSTGPAGDGLFAFLRRLTKSGEDAQLGGVCGGLGEHTPLPSWCWRLVFAVAFFGYGFGLAVYLVLWMFMPDAPEPPDEDSSPSAGPQAVNSKTPGV